MTTATLDMHGNMDARPDGTHPSDAPPARPSPDSPHKHPVSRVGLCLACLLLVCLLIGPVDAALAQTLKWREEVALHDGGIVVVSRTTVLLPSPMLGERVDGKRQLSFTHPTTGKVVTWENAGEIGARVYPMLLDVDGGRAFLVTIAQAGTDYNNFGCPTPPYIVFRQDSTGWTRVALTELPMRFRRANVSTINPDRLQDVIAQAKRYLTAAQIAEFHNSAQDKNSPYVIIDRRIRNPLSLGCDPGTVQRVYGPGKHEEWRGTGTWLDKTEEEVLRLMRQKGEGAKP